MKRPEQPACEKRSPPEANRLELVAAMGALAPLEPDPAATAVARPGWRPVEEGDRDEERDQAEDR
jgi:hypothetical protein